MPRSGPGGAMSIRTGPDWKVRQAAAKGPKPATKEEVYAQIAPRVRYYTEHYSGGAGINSPKDMLKTIHTSKKYVQDRAERVAELMMEHPPEVRDFIAQYELYSPKAWTAEVTRARVGLGTIGMYDKRQRAVHVPRTIKANTFHHEVGHAVFQMSRLSHIWTRRYRNDNKFDRRTSYARTGGAAEGFCETYAAWIKAGGTANTPQDQNAFEVLNRIIEGLR